MSRRSRDDRRLEGAAARLQRRAGGSLDVAIVLGSGLAEATLARIDGSAIPYKKLGAPETGTAGHPGIALTGMLGGARVVAFAGRAHLYRGATPHEVTYLVRLAAAAGAKTIVLTNAAGGLHPAYAAGDVMLVADHLNLTGASPIARDAPDPFVDMLDAYAPRLRALARERAGDERLREGVYAGVRGPQYETPAESAALRRLGADAVGMSTVLETIAARALGLEVLGISLITNAITSVIGAGAKVSHAEVLSASHAGGARVAEIIEATIAGLGVRDDP